MFPLSSSSSSARFLFPLAGIARSPLFLFCAQTNMSALKTAAGAERAEGKKRRFWSARALSFFSFSLVFFSSRALRFRAARHTRKTKSLRSKPKRNEAVKRKRRKERKTRKWRERERRVLSIFFLPLSSSFSLSSSPSPLSLLLPPPSLFSWLVCASAPPACPAARRHLDAVLSGLSRAPSARFLCLLSFASWGRLAQRGRHTLRATWSTQRGHHGKHQALGERASKRVAESVTLVVPLPSIPPCPLRPLFPCLLPPPRRAAGCVLLTRVLPASSPSLLSDRGPRLFS